MLGQGADAQLHGAQVVEVADQFVRRDRNEARCQSTLRHERLRGAVGNLPNGAGDFDVFGEIEIVSAGASRRLGDTDIAVVGETRNDRVDGMILQLRGQCSRVGCINLVRVQFVETMSTDHGLRGLGAHVRQVHFVRTGLGQQTGNQRTDLACAEDENFGHAATPSSRGGGETGRH